MLRNSGGAPPELRSTAHLKALDADNKGFRLLSSMGWAGGALGTAPGSISEPIAVSMRKGRGGLGT